MSESPLIIRRFKKEDEEAVYELHKKAMVAAGAYVNDGHWNNDFKNIESIYIQNGGDFFVGHIDGKLVVMGAIKKHEDGVCELKRLRVDPDSQRRGFGQLMLEKIESRAKELGFKKMELDVQPIQKPAIALYEKNGFIKVKEGEARGTACIYYEKML